MAPAPPRPSTVEVDVSTCSDGAAEDQLLPVPGWHDGGFRRPLLTSRCGARVAALLLLVLVLALALLAVAVAPPLRASATHVAETKATVSMLSHASVAGPGPDASLPTVWLPLGGSEKNVARDEGAGIGPRIWTGLAGCQARCEANVVCRSFAQCGENQCFLKAKNFNGDELTRPNADCTTYYKTLRILAYRPAVPRLLQPSNGATFTFYMYRAQPHDSYPPVNVNTANLAGVLWYLHNEVVITCPRKFHITRIIRYKVSYKATQPLLDFGMNFGVRYAFDAGLCTGPWECERDTWSRFGYVIGCNDLGKFPYPIGPMPYPDAKWFSLPGPCPSKPWYEETVACKATQPGGLCEGGGPPTGTGSCTYTYEDAGEVNLDDVVGIKGDNELHDDFCRRGCREYTAGRYPAADRGKCTYFWDRIMDPTANRWRMRQVDKAFKDKYPDMPSDGAMQAPKCDFDMDHYFGVGRWKNGGS